MKWILIFQKKIKKKSEEKKLNIFNDFNVFFINII